MNPEIQDKRHRMSNQLFMRGYASMKEILTASFGEWPPKGLDINHDIPHDQKVEFEPIDDPDKFGFAFLGNIFLNKGLLSSAGMAAKVGGTHLLYSALGHEALHILQGYHYERSETLFGAEAGKKAVAGLTSAASNMIMQKLTDYDDRQPQKGQLSSTFNAVARDLVIERMSYYKKGIETQARVHQVMIDGYHYWGRMPQNNDELWMAFSGMGLKPPPEMAKHLETLPQNSTAHDFRMSKPLATPSCTELQAINDSFSVPARDKFWREALPALYADLIEMYGDRQGRERFGLGVNVKGQIQKEVFGKKNIPSS